jgi:hypothetical protein
MFELILVWKSHGDEVYVKEIGYHESVFVLGQYYLKF